MTYLRDFATGNPAAFTFLLAMAGFVCLGLYLTPLCDRDFDAQMERVELEQAYSRMEHHR